MKHKKETIKLLKKYWEKRNIIQRDFIHKEFKIEEAMSKAVGKELEFFYVDGECMGIGAKDFNERFKFPLIHEDELYG